MLVANSDADPTPSEFFVNLRAKLYRKTDDERFSVSERQIFPEEQEEQEMVELLRKER